MANKVTNEALLWEVNRSKVKGEITDELGALWLQLVNSNLNRRGFNRLTYNEDMINDAMMTLCRTWQKFDEVKSSNAYAFFTTYIVCSAHNYNAKERKQQDVKKDYTDSLDNGNKQ